MPASLEPIIGTHNLVKEKVRQKSVVLNILVYCKNYRPLNFRVRSVTFCPWVGRKVRSSMSSLPITCSYSRSYFHSRMMLGFDFCFSLWQIKYSYCFISTKSFWICDDQICSIQRFVCVLSLIYHFAPKIDRLFIQTSRNFTFYGELLYVEVL